MRRLGSGYPRHRYVIEDPVRFGCLCATGTLLFLPDIPFVLTLLIVLVVQTAPVMMIARAAEPGWSRRYGRYVRESLFASNLSMDFARLSACAVVGALLLVRQFNGPEVVKPLGILAAGLCFLPDARVCRWLLGGDPAEQSRALREGTFLRDPVMFGAILASGAVCLIDRVSLEFLLLSLLFLQFNALLVFFDKYVPEVETRRFRGWKGLLLEREPRRLILCLAPLALVPLRVYFGDRAALTGAGAVGAAVVVPDVLRLLWAAVRGLGNLLRVTPAPAGASTHVVLPRS